MVEVHVLDESSVAFPSGSVTGPFTVRADKVTVGANEFTSGVVLVRSGSATQTMSMSPVHAQAWPYAVLISVFLGVWLARTR